MRRLELRSERRRVESSTLARFVPLLESQSALMAVRDMAEAVTADRAIAPLLLHGPPGTGKSHLATAVAEEVLCQRSDATAQVISARDLGFGDASAELHEADLSCDLLVIEDLHYLPERAVLRLGEIWDYRLVHGLATLCTAAGGPRQLEITGRLRSRLAGGLLVGLSPLGVNSRRRLLTELARRKDLPVPDEALDWLARLLTGNARVLEGAIQQLEMLARLGRRLNLETVAGQWGDQVEADQPMLERIGRRVCDHFGVETRLLGSAGRRGGALLPRQVSMYLARRLTGLSLGAIGSYFGGRDHTTVLHACRKIEQALTEDFVLAGTVRQLSAELT